jgi:Ribonuclease G/E
LERLLLAEVGFFLKQAQLNARKVGTHQEKSDNKKMLENLKAQVTRLNYSWQTGKILDVAQYEKQYAELIGKIEELEKVRPIEKKKDFKYIEKILYDGWQDSYLKLSEKNKKAFWRSFIKRIVVNWTTDVKEIAEIEFL